MIQRVDFLIADSKGLYATGMRAYINHINIKGLKCIDVAEGYDISYKKGSFYFLFTLFADERDIEVKDSVLKIGTKFKKQKGRE